MKKVIFALTFVTAMFICTLNVKAEENYVSTYFHDKEAISSTTPSIIYTIDEADDGKYFVPEDYQWTFATSTIDASKTEYCKKDNGEDCLWVLKKNDVIKSEEEVNGVSGINYRVRKGNSTYWFYNNLFPDEGYLPNDSTITYFLNRDTLYCTDYTADVFVYYPYVGTYEGEKIGLRITLVDFKIFPKIKTSGLTEDGENGNKAVPILSFYKDRPKIEMYGVNSAQFKYEFVNNSCYQSHKNDYYNQGCVRNIKGYGTLTDVDGGQAVTLNTTKTSGVSEINNCNTLRLQNSEINSGITKAYIYKNAKVCTDYRSKETKSYAGRNASNLPIYDSNYNSSKPNTWYRYNSYGSNQGACATAKITNPYSSDYGGYSYLLPHYAPYGADQVASSIKFGLKPNLVINQGVNDDRGTNGGKIDTITGNNYGVNYHKKVNTIASPEIAVKSEKLSWIEILYDGSFTLTYYFTNPEAFFSEDETCNNKESCDDEDVDRTYKISGYKSVGGDYSKVTGGGGGTYDFTQHSLLTIKPEAVYRTIDINNPFLDKNGLTRNTGQNWCDGSNCKYNNGKVTKYIKNSKSSSSTGKATYCYKLDRNILKSIRACDENDLSDDEHLSEKCQIMDELIDREGDC